MLLSFAVKLCGWFFDLDFCVYGFEFDPLRLLLYGWLFAVRVLRFIREYIFRGWRLCGRKSCRCDLHPERQPTSGPRPHESHAGY